MSLVEIQPQEENKCFKDVVLFLMANGLAQEVEHPEIQIILLDLPIPDLEIVEKRNDEIYQRFVMIEVNMICIRVNKRDDLGKALLPRERQFAIISLTIQHLS